MVPVPIRVNTRCPEAASTPTAAEHQSVAAVFRPRTLNPSRRMTPPPRNPIPETT
ncbi:Uncharacterised protein [Mycobacterium tuberculosis]|nr:Uncharacterised protein [Mycobacterium tuberculosis]COZ72975.1 Uncharacterised protein [Mycobacterium tuberculosis]